MARPDSQEPGGAPVLISASESSGKNSIPGIRHTLFEALSASSRNAGLSGYWAVGQTTRQGNRSLPTHRTRIEFRRLVMGRSLAALAEVSVSCRADRGALRWNSSTVQRRGWADGFCINCRCGCAAKSFGSRVRRCSVGPGSRLAVISPRPLPWLVGRIINYCLAIGYAKKGM